MLRTSQSVNDPLLNIIRQTSYAENAPAIATLFRQMLSSYHNKEDRDKDAEVLSHRLINAIPLAHKISVVGTYPVYRLRIQDKTYRCTWRELLAKGSYNQVYNADLTELADSQDIQTAETVPAVVKIAMQSNKDLRVYLLENVIHAILWYLPATKAYVVPMCFPFRVKQSGYPPYLLGTVMHDPGHGDLGTWVCDVMESDHQMFSILTQISWILYKMQKAVQFQHRDLKCDNIMIVESADSESIEVPELNLDFRNSNIGIRCLLIDFGMSRFEVNGEYVACDCMHTNTDLNRCHDLQYFCCSLVEDYEEELQRSAPKFYKWLSAICKPLFMKLHENWPDYDDVCAAKKHERLSYLVAKEKHHNFMPSHMLRLLSKHV